MTRLRLRLRLRARVMARPRVNFKSSATVICLQSRVRIEGFKALSRVGAGSGAAGRARGCNNDR